MKIAQVNKISFKGYDAIPLKGLYMQGLVSRCEQNIFNEMKTIADIENLEMHFNQNNSSISNNYNYNLVPDATLSIWGQDRKAFVENNNVKTLLWDSIEEKLQSDDLGTLKDYKVVESSYLPRGGNYYLGYNQNGEKWLLINSMSVYNNEAFDMYGDIPIKEHLAKFFDVEPKNIIVVKEFFKDLDEVVRPIGYPYILVDDSAESLKNIEKLREKFPDCEETYNALKNYVENLDADIKFDMRKNLVSDLEQYGFIPIKIGGSYFHGINFLNAIAFKDRKGQVSYITNATKCSSPELEYLEKLFVSDLKEKFKNLGNIYFVSGGHLTKTQKYINSFRCDFELPDMGFKNSNVIMDIYANRQGGIHCMTAEIPDFDRLG